MQIILLGQPELRDMLNRPELRQLAQRITARYHLTPLDAVETEAYVKHRMAVAGCQRVPFSRLGMRALFQRSGGIPRLINVIADRALMAGYAREQQSIGERLVDRWPTKPCPVTPLLGATVCALGAGCPVLWRQPFSRCAQCRMNRPWPTWPRSPQPRRAHQPMPALLASKRAWLRSRKTELWHSPIAVALADRLGRGLGTRGDALPGAGARAFSACVGGPLWNRYCALIPVDSRPWQRGKPMHVLLQGAGKREVHVDLGGETIKLPRAALSRYWAGDFIAIWRVPAAVNGPLRKGDAGAGVAWAKQNLSRLDAGANAEAGPAYFDAELEERVRKLQLAYGIQADGIIGPETLFALSALEETGPHLTRNIE